MRKLIAFFAFLLVAIPANAANWYVNKAAGGSNNGTSWTNAWTDFGSINFSTVACGDTIWVAAGTYTGSMTWSKVCTSGNVLTISSVLSTDTVPTSAPGYSSSYAYPNQVVNNNGSISWSSSYITMDGRMGDAQSGIPYGIQYLYTGNSAKAICMQGPCGNNTTVSAVGNTIRHVELNGPSCVTGGTCTGNTWGITDNGYTNTTDTNTVIDHCWVHRFAEVLRFYETTNITVEYSYIGEDVTANTADHEDLVYLSNPVNGMTMIGNTWYSSGNDGIFMDNGGATNVVFVNNVFQHWGSWSLSFGKTGTCGPYIVVNNTFANDGLGMGEGYTYGTIGTGGCTLNASSIWTNNIFYNTANVGNANAVLTYNAGTTANGGSWSCGTGCFSYTRATPISSFNGFVNFVPSGVGGGSTGSTIAVTADLHLSSAGITLFQGKGTNLTSQCGTYPSFCIDKDGNARPSSGAWDLGAYNASAATQAAPPSCTPAAGTYNLTQSATCTNPNSGTTVMCYTLNGTTPATNGAGTACTTGTVYSTAIPITISETLKAIAGTSTLTDSTVSSYAYVLQGSPPAFSPVAGTYTSIQSVTLTNPSSTPVRCYTTNGTTPATNGGSGCTTGTLYSGAISVGVTQTIKAVAGGTGWTDSTVASALYTINLNISANPVFSPCAGPVCNFTGSQVVTLTSSTGAAVICVRADGTAPTTLAAGTCGTGSTTVANGGTITVGSSETAQALATAVGFTNSAVVTVTFNIGTAAAVSMFGD